MYTGGISSRVVDGADQPRDGPSVVVVVDFRERESRQGKRPLFCLIKTKRLLHKISVHRSL